MTTIGYNDIENVLLSLQDPNTGSAVTSVPGVNSPKINAVTSIYNEQGGGEGIAGWSTNINWYALDYNTVSRGSGSVYLPDGTELTVTASNTGNMSTTTYIYYDREDDTVKTTTSASSSVGEKKILLCVAAPTTSGKNAEFQAFGTNDQSTFIYASNIAANTITGNEIAANTITASEIQSGAITSDKIHAGSVTAGKINVTQLSDIDPDLGTITAGTLKGTTVIAGDTSSAAIKLYPYTSSQGRLEFYYNGSVVGYMYGDYNSSAGGSLVRLYSGNSILLDGDIYVLYRDVVDLSQGKLRIPVGSDLY